MIEMLSWKDDPLEEHGKLERLSCYFICFSNLILYFLTYLQWLQIIDDFDMSDFVREKDTKYVSWQKIYKG